MPFNTTLPPENTNPWYTPFVVNFVDGLRNFVNALEAKIGVANGIASLGSDGKLPAAQLPAIAVQDFLGTVATQAAMIALVGEKGDWAIRSDRGTVFIITGANPAVLGSWTEMAYPTAPVTSVAGRTGTVVLAKADVGLPNVDNTADSAKPVSTAQAAAIATKVTRLGAATGLWIGPAADVPAPGDQVAGVLYVSQG